MAKIQIQPDCGNAPKKLFLKDFFTAFANADEEYLSAIIPDGITWEIVGQNQINGKEAFLTELTRHRVWKAKEVIIDSIITHGPDAAVSGRILTADRQRYAFSDIFKFKSAGATAINSLTTFFIRL